MEFKKIYLDINIVLDLLNQQRDNHLYANKLVKYCILNNIDIVISEDMLSTIFYINKNKKQTLNLFNVILEDWIVVAFGNKVIKDSIALSLQNNLDFEDVLQCICAKENGCDIFITNDKKFYNCSISIMATEEFVKSFIN